MNFNTMTDKQELFIREYLIDFNATRAAKKAGYSEKTAYSQGQRLLKNVEVKNKITSLKKERISDLIATKEQRQKFWSKTMYDEEVDMKNRLRASELLGKSCGDFIDRVETKNENNLDMRAQIRAVLLKRLSEQNDNISSLDLKN